VVNALAQFTGGGGWTAGRRAQQPETRSPIGMGGKKAGTMAKQFQRFGQQVLPGGSPRANRNEKDELPALKRERSGYLQPF